MTVTDRCNFNIRFTFVSYICQTFSSVHSHDKLQYRSSMHRTQSATSPDSAHYPDHPISMRHDRMAPIHSISEEGGNMEDEPLPPPPPPIYEPEGSMREDWQSTGTGGRSQEATMVSRSTTSAASATLTSSASITSSKGTEDSEEDGRRKVWIMNFTVKQETFTWAIYIPYFCKYVKLVKFSCLKNYNYNPQMHLRNICTCMKC